MTIIFNYDLKQWHFSKLCHQLLTMTRGASELLKFHTSKLFLWNKVYTDSAMIKKILYAVSTENRVAKFFAMYVLQESPWSCKFNLVKSQ
jgi:hypothetical protein